MKRIILAILIGCVLAAPVCPVAAQSAEAPPIGPSTNLVTEVTKLLQAHTSGQVLRDFIGNWSTPYLTSVDDLLALKRAGADPDLLNAYARRGAELRLRAAERLAQGNTNAPPGAPRVILYPVPVPASSWSDSMRSSTPYYFSESLPWWGEAYGGAWLGGWITPWWAAPWGYDGLSRGHYWR